MVLTDINSFISCVLENGSSTGAFLDFVRGSERSQHPRVGFARLDLQGFR